ncbi:hypothetical protein DFH06DRAFT_1394571 [Mycena polygramma]|nr:hypothetical protein DFH06DRAFT_1394571 [Mycena polygramma]
MFPTLWAPPNSVPALFSSSVPRSACYTPRLVNRDAATPQSTTGGGKLNPLFGCGPRRSEHRREGRTPPPDPAERATKLVCSALDAARPRCSVQRTLQLPMMTPPPRKRASALDAIARKIHPTRCVHIHHSRPARASLAAYHICWSSPSSPRGSHCRLHRPGGPCVGDISIALARAPAAFLLTAPLPGARAHEESHAQSPASLRRIRTLRRLNDSADVTAETSSRKGKVLYEVRQAAGTVVHPSGFNPSTPADEFEHSGNCTTDSHIGQQPLVLGKRGFHTTAVSRAQEVQLDFNPVLAKQQLSETFVPRDVYTPTLATTPFWRPLITLTTSTCPIAMTLVPLAKGLPTGRPFHDTDNHDKKCRIP